MSLILILIFFLLANTLFTNLFIDSPQNIINLFAMASKFFIIAVVAILISWTMGDN